MEIFRETPEGIVSVKSLPSQQLQITLIPMKSDNIIEKPSCVTYFPISVVDQFISLCPFGSICALLFRHEDSEFLSIIQRQLFSYMQPSEFEGKSLLDFGCGSGASALAIASWLPKTEVVGIDLSPERISLAKTVADAQGIKNATFLVSPAGDRIPAGLGKFDFITLNAVYEHLLPRERKALMPLLWSMMKESSVLFVNQTPHRYFPYEHHSTLLPLINYLPDRLAHYAARRFARMNPKVNRSQDWDLLLRHGIRGGTEGEIVRNLCAKGGKATILQPKAEGVRDRASYWLSCTNQNRYRLAKRTISVFFRFCDRVFGTIPSLNIDVAIRKEA